MAKNKRALPEAEPKMLHLGNMLRTHREGRMTVDELAESAGVSGGLISQLERGIGNPSFNTLMRLSRALGLPIAAFFQGATAYDPARIIVRRKERQKLTMENGLEQELLTPDGSPKLGIVRTVVPAGYSSEDTPMSHVGEESFVVESGQLAVALDGHWYTLDEGDSITFDSSVPHAYANRGSEVVVFYGCSTPPTISGRY